MVKPGYKETEVGVIPEEWHICELRNISDVKTGPFGSALHAEDYVQSGTPIITVEHLGEKAITRQNLPLVSDEDVKRLSAYILHCGDIVFSRVGSVDRNAYVTQAEDGWLFSGRLLRIRPKSKDIDAKYLGYYFKFETVKNRIRDIAVGQTMASLNTKLMNSFLILLPPIKVQQKIAEALSDMDELIASLEKLIAKKKAIKQGTMQELLTGKKRLPGFDGEWVHVELSQVCSHITDGSHVSPQGVENGYYMPSVKDMRANSFDYSECKSVSFTDYKMLEKNGCRPKVGDVLIAKDGSILKYAFVQKKDEKIVILSSIAIIRPIHSVVDSYFIAQYFKQEKFVEETKTNYKSGTGVPRIVLSGFKKIPLYIPKSIKEQQAIASILSDMDAEIEALEQKLTKCRQTKQGMMQQLLTGKIRLV